MTCFPSCLDGGRLSPLPPLCEARIQGVGAGARAHPWGGVSPFKIHNSILVAFKRQSITGRPPLGEILKS